MREEFFSTCPICGTTYNLEMYEDCPHCGANPDDDWDDEDDFLEFESEE